MKLYSALNRAPIPKSYVGKLFVICFAGTHAPLAAFAVYALVALPFDRHLTTLATLILVATLAGTGLTLALVHGLLSPILLARRALQAYRTDRTRPQLPTRFKDEAGALLSEVQSVIDQLEDTLADLERQSLTDPLTQCGNRRWFLERGSSALRLAQDEGRPVSVVIIDVDHFKRINDEFGHEAGDQVLVGVVATIRAKIRSQATDTRPMDIFARIGGEEFGLVLPNTPFAHAVTVAERLRAAIADTDLPVLGRRVTASFGVTCSGGSERSLLELVRRADMWLYAAKKSGRNKVCSGMSFERVEPPLVLKSA